MRDSCPSGCESKRILKTLLLIRATVRLSSCSWSLNLRFCFSLYPQPLTLGDFSACLEMYCHCSQDRKLEELQSRTKEHSCINTDGLTGAHAFLLDAPGLIGTLPATRCFLSSSQYFSEFLLCASHPAGPCVWNMETVKMEELALCQDGGQGGRSLEAHLIQTLPFCRWRR